MGNVQCCASGRFPEGNLPKKPKNKKKKALKGVSKKSNGVSGKGNGGVQRVVTVAEDGSERAAPAATSAEPLAQTAPPIIGALTADAPETSEEEALNESNYTDNDAPRNESMAAARERFFTQVSESISVCKCLRILVAIATQEHYKWCVA